VDACAAVISLIGRGTCATTTDARGTVQPVGDGGSHALLKAADSRD